MRLMLESVVSSALAIVRVELLLLYIICIFAIVGSNLYAGAFYDCSRGQGAGIEYQPECVGTFIETSVVCNKDRRNQTCTEHSIISEREWVNWDSNFDNIINSFMTFFELSTFQGWAEVARLTIDATEVGQAPIENNKQYMIVFTMFYLIFCSYFFMNTFVGVIYNNFQRRKDESTGKATMAPAQLRWLDIVEMMCTSAPRRRAKAPPQQWRQGIFWIGTHNNFDNFITAIIVVNTLMMMAEFYTQPPVMHTVLEISNVVFTVIFFVEAVIKIVGLGWGQYWLSTWNKFDFVICTVSVIDIMFLYIATAIAGPKVVKVFRLGRIISRLLKILRIGRTVRISGQVKALKVLVITLAKSVPYVSVCFGLYLLYIR